MGGHQDPAGTLVRRPARHRCRRGSPRRCPAGCGSGVAEVVARLEARQQAVVGQVVEVDEPASWSGARRLRRIGARRVCRIVVSKRPGSTAAACWGGPTAGRGGWPRPAPSVRRPRGSPTRGRPRRTRPGRCRSPAAGLGGHRGGGVERVLVLHPVDHRRGVDEVLAAEGHQVVGLRGQPLEPGQVVGHGHRAGLGAADAGSSTRRARPPRRAATRCRCAAGPCWASRGSHARTSRCSTVGDSSMLSACDGWVATTTASYDAVSPLPSVTSTPSAVSRTEVTLVLEADLGKVLGHGGDVGARAAGDGPPRGRAEDAEHPVVLEEREEVARGVVQRRRRVARPDGGHQRLHEVPHEVGAEAALVEEGPQRLVPADVIRARTPGSTDG